MTSEERAINWISCNIDNEDEVYREGILYTLKRLLAHHAAEARVELSNRVRRHLERVDERECSLKAWNAICDALLELHGDE